MLQVALGTSVAEWLIRLALKTLAPLRYGSGLNPVIGSCHLLNGRFLTPSHQQFVPPAVQTDRHIRLYNQTKAENVGLIPNSACNVLP